jgi:CelD/BcsL family acetyltransferase involved in cellulose biosynthesis
MEEIKIISNNAEFDAIEIAWSLLFVRSDVTVFQSFEWLRTWWKYFSKPNFKLHIILFYKNGELVGIAPLFMEVIKIAGVPIIRHLQFIGRGLSDYVNLIIKPGDEEFVFEKFAGYLSSTTSSWDIFDIEDVNEETILLNRFPDYLEKYGLSLFSYQGNVCPQVKLPTSPELLIEGMGQTSGHNYKRKLKKFQSNFKSEIELYQHETDDLQKGIEEFSDIHGSRWKSLGYPSAFDSLSHRNFHLEFSRKFARNNWLRLYIMKIDNKPVAASYGFYFKKRIYMYQSNAYASDDIMRCSPGLLLRSFAMMEGIKEGMEIFDYMRGDETYKFSDWKSDSKRNYLFRIKSSKLRKTPPYLLYLAYELFNKCLIRIRREYYEYRRFILAKPRTITSRIFYCGTRIKDLSRLGYNFIIRYLPLRFIHKFERRKTSSVERQDSSSLEQ